MAQRIRKDDLVKVIAGKNKGITGRVLSVLPAKNMALVEGVGLGRRHVKPSQINPRGGKKDIHVGISLHKLALVVDEKTSKTSRVGYKVTDGVKARVARQQKNKEIK
ncbi:50S ribosomal protein L24 [Candidatus Saccharibacteria bacterium oral taxon 955]|nr:50S ribosomal protein L24 [Candidatus Saccharibacteria bacterium oral taxon 955]QJU05865.1 50S ribosomal protein L24 [Candidatus Saccharibacteria bacterium oral taxon 955]